MGPHRRSGGFTLIEVLVAVLVLAIGLLGVAALQTSALRLNSDAYNRTQAQVLLDDLTERMRANWDGSGDSLVSYKTAFDAAGTDDCEADTYGQTDDARTAEVGCWLEQVQSALGTGFTPVLVRTDTADATNRYFNVQLGWRDRQLETETECTSFNDTADGAIAVRAWQAAAGADADDKTCFVVFTWSVTL